MKFILTFTLPPATRDEVSARSGRLETSPDTDQTGEEIAVPPLAVPGGLEGEGEEPGQAGDRR
jgi:hypothetical protein